jgi:hypothetical protein
MSIPFDQNYFARLIGESPAALPEPVLELLQQYALHFTPLAGEAREACFLEVLKKMEAPLTVSGAHRLQDWETGWSENLKRFEESGGDPESLVPRYLQPDQIDRCLGDFIRSEIPYFQVRFYDIFRHYLYYRYLQRVSHVYEFGCGTGYNLTILSRLFPDKQIRGFDWAEASVRLVNAIGSMCQLNLSGTRFDMFHPDPHLQIPSDTAVITFNAMEQLGKNFQPFIDYLCTQKFELAVHAEPLLELYDQNHLFDYLAARYHRVRGYLEGFVPYMQHLEQQGRIQILKLQRIPFGNQFHEGYSLLIWKPVA